MRTWLQLNKTKAERGSDCFLLYSRQLQEIKELVKRKANLYPFALVLLPINTLRGIQAYEHSHKRDESLEER